MKLTTWQHNSKEVSNQTKINLRTLFSKLLILDDRCWETSKSIKLRTRPSSAIKSTKRRFFGDSERRHKDSCEQKEGGRVCICCQEYEPYQIQFAFQVQFFCLQSHLKITHSSSSQNIKMKFVKKGVQVISVPLRYFWNDVFWLYCFVCSIVCWFDCSFSQTWTTIKTTLTLILIHKFWFVRRLCWDLSECYSYHCLIVKMIMHNEKENKKLDKWICKCCFAVISFVCYTHAALKTKRCATVEEWMFEKSRIYIPQVKFEQLDLISQAERSHSTVRSPSIWGQTSINSRWWVTNATFFQLGFSFSNCLSRQYCNWNGLLVDQNRFLCTSRRIMTFSNVFDEECKVGLEWLITIYVTEIHIFEVPEEFVGTVIVITLSTCQFCVFTQLWYW